MSWPRALASWFALALLMVANGFARERLLDGVVDPLRAHQISSVTGMVLIVLASLRLVPWIGARSVSQQIGLGLAWVACTIAFEFSFGHWVVGHTWRTLFADYDVASGRLWVFVLLATAAAPWLVGRVRELRVHPRARPPAD